MGTNIVFSFLLLWIIVFCNCYHDLDQERLQFSSNLANIFGTKSIHQLHSGGVKTMTAKSAIVGGCNESPAAPINAGIKCSLYSGCRASCIPYYQFPNGETQLFITCIHGQWQIEGTEWNTIPACEPICMPPCLNNGICVAPNQCNCPENFLGPECQFENVPCMNFPPMTINAKRSCNSETCIISCLEGHQFPDGSQITNLVCNNGMWVPAREDWVSIPDCTPICSPPCQNGGNCLSFNVCQCPQEYKGSQCQYRTDACSSRKLQFNGGYNCSSREDGFGCSLSCPEGVKFEFSPAPLYLCDYETGVFLPSPIPQCIFGDLIPLSQGNVYYNEFNSSFVLNGQRMEGTGEFNINTINRILPEFLFPQPNFPSLTSFNDTNKIDYYNIINLNRPDKDDGEYLTVEKKQPVPGVCFTWGGVHYKTFDGKVFSFDSPCAHVLIQDSQDHSFSITVQNNKECQGTLRECYRIINIYLEGKEYVFKKTGEGVAVFKSSKKTYPIPIRLPGIRVQMSAHYFVVILDTIGLTIKWDNEQLVQIEVKENLWNRTEGLCGIIDGNPDNDLVTKTRNIPKSIATLATSWQVNKLEESCDAIPKEKNSCDNYIENDSGIRSEAQRFCHNLLSDKRFKTCQSVMDVFVLFDACLWDYCNCPDLPERCACQTLTVYTRECSHKGITALKKWRDNEFCPIVCNGNRVYMPCAPSEGQQVCGDVREIANDDDSYCQEGCYCPEGTVLHDSRCISKDQCPCRLRGKEFPPRSSVPKDCNTCTCSNGKWICTQVACGARCSALGDPHYITFDQKRYDFMGRCSYYLVKHNNFSIEAENVPCNGAISQAMNLLPSNVISGLPSCTKTVTIKIDGHMIKLKQNHEVVVNGQEVLKLPHTISGINIRSVSSLFILVELAQKVEIWWDGFTRVYIDMPAFFKGTTQGLCGTFNGNQKDDFLTPEGDVEKTPETFANKWKTSEKCNDVPEKIVAHPCEANIQNYAIAQERCALIKSKVLFQDCHWFVDPEPYYQDCLYDVCACDKKISKCLCPIIAAYAYECALKGIKINWREDVRECGLHCPGGQKYQVCSNSCARTCSEVSLYPDCNRACVEGCNCPEGQALDEYGECVLIGQCNCQYEGLEFRAGYKEVRPASVGLELCSCVNARWSCVPATEEDTNLYPQASILKATCDHSKNYEFTTCEPTEPVTCKNLHTLEMVSASVCHPGCQCKEGFVLDSHSGTCIRPTQCPCHHGGRSYGENFTVQNDCNTCKCKGGKWECTKRLCSGECVSWGDSHYKTFDGKMYDYQGQCDYVLAKGALFDDDTFDISIENVPCGSLGVSCSKSVTIRVGRGYQSEKITLSKERNVPDGTALKRLTVRHKGLFVIVEAAELGLVVLWDKGTRVYVKLDPRWKSKVKGLCGNYNDNENDDFQTPSEGIAEVSAQLFGDSWRLQSYCPELDEITDTCEQRPERKMWATKKCGILKTPLFAPCHSEVSVDDYYNRCIFDACACDQGGDCECLCTALAAYAQECNHKGVPIKWRSQKLCPMQCDERCSEYSPCISTCPIETCDNLLIQNKFSRMCEEDSCIEGCQTKPCSPGHVYVNSSALDCVPRNSCRPPFCLEIAGIVYYEGDLIEEDRCHSCFCSRGQRVCKGQPCINNTTATTTNNTTPKQEKTTTVEMLKEQRLLCVNGWTEWINQDRNPTSKVKGGVVPKLNDVEPLPSEIFMNEIKKKGRCSVNEMVDIECRTVRGHKHPKETGLDVECSLEKGLLCTSTNPTKPCGDFEIRVKCQCEEKAYVSTSTIPCDGNFPNHEHPTDCRLFYHCTTDTSGKTRLVEKSCGSGTLFNPVTQVCDWPDAVLKIKPQCGEEGAVILTTLPATTTTTTETVTKAPVCPDGEKFDSCAIDCNNMCMYYKYLVIQSGFCNNNYEECVPDCVVEEKQPSCPFDMLWSSNQTCLYKQDCMCVSDDGKPVKPGTVIKQNDCAICQCVDNFLICDDSGCNTARPITETTLSALLPKTKKPKPTTTTTTTTTITTTTSYNLPVVKTTVTPPEECDENRFINLIDGDAPLPDEAFSASSELSRFFAPQYARLNSTVTEKSGGCWIPKISDENQFLQIDLGVQEPVYGIIIKGSPLYNNFVTSYKVAYSPDSISFRYVNDQNDRPKIFRGPTDNKGQVKQLFEVPVEASAVKILPNTWYGEIAIKVELIGCSEKLTTTTTDEPIFTTSPKLLTKPPPPICTDPMGLDDGMLNDQMISVSSDINPEHDKSKLRINGNSYWQPLTNSPLEWVQFDFLEARNLTGFISKGGQDGWVTTFKVQFSLDEKTWITILDGGKREMIFLGNYDETLEHVNYFNLPIHARFLKIFPITWHKNIQLRIEILGCFKPYHINEITTGKPTTMGQNNGCYSCPGVPNTDMELGACMCSAELFWDGENCVPKNQCPCLVGHMAYAVGTVFEKEDCSQCICKLGGTEHCTPKQCEKCEEGLRSTVTGTCGCICRPCSEGTTLCPTDNICINDTFWCNGVEDCSDDEISCLTSPSAPFTTPTKITTKTVTESHVKKCQVPSCPPGYRVTIKKESRSESLHSNLSPMFSTFGRKAATKKSYRSLSKSYTKSGRKSSLVYEQKKKIKTPREKSKEALTEQKDECPYFICESTRLPPKFINGTVEEYRCPPVTCPSGYTPQYDVETTKSTEFTCPKYECQPPLLPDVVCNVTGRIFITFDNTEYKYDICEHVLARDLENEKWEIILKKNCSETCSRDLYIYYDKHTLIIRRDLSIEFDNYKYTVDQTKQIGSQSQSFILSKLGNAILFVSNEYGFWIIWDKKADVKIGLSGKLEGKVDGMCGFFNYKRNDDKRKPDGKIAKTTAEFADSWALNEDRRPQICEIKVCPVHVQNRAWKMCQTVRKGSLNLCENAVDIDAFISRCLETTCTCLQNAGEDRIKTSGCRCEALQSFVVDCMATETEIDLSDWRTQHNCPAVCNGSLVHYDCYRRRCEPSCETLSDINSCLQLSHMCFPGCYCPPGYVRKGDDCVLPSTCRDCECTVLPHSQYLRYDGNNITVGANCDYVMTKNVIEKDNGDTYQFQIVVSNRPCNDNKGKSCIAKVTIIYNEHVVEVDSDNKRMRVMIDFVHLLNYDLMSKYDWLLIEEDLLKNLNIILLKNQIEIHIFYPSFGMSVRMPSNKYSGKLEGLCGDCNRDDSKIIPHDDNTLTPINSEEFALSWLAEGQSKDKCMSKPFVDKCIQQYDVESDPCLVLADEDVFGRCHPLIDPTMYMEWCKKDTCNDKAEASCESVAAYARECGQLGVCVQWRHNVAALCPSATCPDGFEYKPCAPECIKTCQDVRENVTCSKNKKTLPLEGCFCPEGKVLSNDGYNCVEEETCQVCDNEGHHVGDVWQKDSCTRCTCSTGRNVQCETNTCPSFETVCEQGYTAVKLSTNKDECCDKFVCVRSKPKTTCPPPQEIRCAGDQVAKIITNEDGCQHFICQCKSKDECEPVDFTIYNNNNNNNLEPGFEIVLNTSGCCPFNERVCNVKKCPDAPQCPTYHTLQSDTALSGSCCPRYNCLPPFEECIVNLKYTNAEGGGERLRNDYEAKQVLKKINETWNDGPCRTCKCVITTSSSSSSSNTTPVYGCSVTECLLASDSSDFEFYVLEEAFLNDDDDNSNQCCPNFVRKACKYDGNVYQPGSKWPASKNDFCNMMECVKSNGNVRIERQTITCDTECESGFKYRPPPPPPPPPPSGNYSDQQCCGSCVPFACVVDGVVRNLGEKWSSNDYCTSYECNNDVNGSLQVQSTTRDCSKISTEFLKDYVYQVVQVEGECCPEYKIIGCKDGKKEYMINDSWLSSDGDKCKSFTCLNNSFGEVIKKEAIESCNENCTLGWKYMKYNNSSCCGSCEQFACVSNNTLKYPGETWTDGPCKQCTCVSTGSNGFSQECTTNECMSLEDSPDFVDYVIETVNEHRNQCCPTLVRSACKNKEKTYKSGEQWFGNDEDFCNIFKCIEEMNGIIRKEKETIVCNNSTCDLGWEYRPPRPDLKQCCGSCVPVNCIVDGIAHKTNEHWKSQDFCTNYECLNVNGSLQVQAVPVVCPAIPEDHLNEYVYDFIASEGECCKKPKIVGCKMKENIYKVGDSWPSPDGDICKKYTCTQNNNNNNEIVKQELIETCSKNCSKGWEYKESVGECCGKCEPVACVINETIKHPNDVWKSEDGCTTYTCEFLGEQLAITSSQESCPNIEECPPQNQYVKNCCKHCNTTNTVSHVSCSSQEISPSKTLGLVKVKRSEHGECVNKYQLKNLRECIGTCQSSTSFNIESGIYESICSCCQATKYESVAVELECEDGYKYKKHINVPAKCNCESCSQFIGTKTSKTKSQRKSLE